MKNLFSSHFILLAFDLKTRFIVRVQGLSESTLSLMVFRVDYLNRKIPWISVSKPRSCIIIVILNILAIAFICLVIIITLIGHAWSKIATDLLYVGSFLWRRLHKLWGCCLDEIIWFRSSNSCLNRSIFSMGSYRWKTLDVHVSRIQALISLTFVTLVVDHRPFKLLFKFHILLFQIAYLVF